MVSLEDYSNEYLAVSSNKATNPPALCLNTEEVAKVFDEVLAYLIFRRKDLLDDYVALSFNEMKERKNAFHTPFVTKPFHCPVFLDDESKLPRIPTKEEYFAWLRGEGLNVYRKAREQWMIEKKYTARHSSLLLCENLDHSYEAIRVQPHIRDIFVWAYSTMNVNEHLSPLIAVNSEGYRKL